jgi:hypothetical protein
LFFPQKIFLAKGEMNYPVSWAKLDPQLSFSCAIPPHQSWKSVEGNMVTRRHFDLEDGFAGLDFHSVCLEQRSIRAMEALAQRPDASIWEACETGLMKLYIPPACRDHLV